MKKRIKLSRGTFRKILLYPFGFFFVFFTIPNMFDFTYGIDKDLSVKIIVINAVILTLNVIITTFFEDKIFNQNKNKIL